MRSFQRRRTTTATAARLTGERTLPLSHPSCRISHPPPPPRPSPPGPAPPGLRARCAPSPPLSRRAARRLRGAPALPPRPVSQTGAGSDGPDRPNNRPTGTGGERPLVARPPPGRAGAAGGPPPHGRRYVTPVARRRPAPAARTYLGLRPARRPPLL